VARDAHLPAHLRVDAVRARRERRQVQRWLGHHSPAFTLSAYVHLLDSGVGNPLDLVAELDWGGNRVATRATGHDRTRPESVFAETLFSGENTEPATTGRTRCVVS